MTHVGYLVGGYGLTAAVLIGYVLRLRSRGRALARLSGAYSAVPSPARPAATGADLPPAGPASTPSAPPP